MSQQKFRKRATFHASKWTWRPIRNFLDQSSWYNSQIRLWQRWCCGLQVNLFQKHFHQLTQIFHWITSSVDENCKLRTWEEHVVYTNWVFCDIQSNLCTQHVLPMLSPCSELAIFIYWICNSAKDLLSFVG